MEEINTDPATQLQLVVSGTHLVSEYGLTIKDIQNDGFKVDEKVEMLLSSDSPVAITKSLSLASIGFSEAFDRLSPDIVVLLGDRYEMLAAGISAMIARIPIAHIHGGEATEGLIDEAIRHSLTKMSHIHFVTHESYKKRVAQMGENCSLIFNFGAPGLDQVFKLKLLTREQLLADLNLPLDKPFFLFTYHPLTLEKNDEQSIQNIFSALQKFKDYSIIFTGTNADTENFMIKKFVLEFINKLDGSAKLFSSLGSLKYLSALKHCEAVLGNSSSGIIEAPALKTATVNIGDRQKGRVRAESIIDVGFNTDRIVQGIAEAISPNFQEKIKSMDCPFGDGTASKNIKNKLKEIDLSDITRKSFRDIA